LKKTLVLVLIFIMMFSLPSCSGRKSPAVGGSGTSMPVFASRADIEAKLTNYKITVEFTDETGNKTEMTELRCDRGYIWMIGGSMLYIEYGTGKQYTLYRENMTGIAAKLDDEDSYKTFGAVISAYLFFHEPYINGELAKAGAEKIAGRDTTAYTFNAGGFANKFWLDDEYGVTMKYQMKTSARSGSMEVKELSVGHAALTDMVNLSEYKITDLSN